LPMLTERYRVADAFDLIVGSAYEGILKPAPGNFSAHAGAPGTAAGRGDFHRRLAQNVAWARAVGMFAVQLTPDLDVAAALAAHGLNLSR
jgi:hypothetical protein